MKAFKLFLDLDGVMANYTKAIKDQFDIEYPKVHLPDDEFEKFHTNLFRQIEPLGSLFWEDLEMMPDANLLYSHIKHLHPSILTAYPSHWIDQYNKDKCRIGKRRWVRTHLGINELDRFNICYAKEKHKCVDPNYHCILIDDIKHNIDNWESAGGIGIHHTSAVSSIYKFNNILEELYVNS